MTTLQGELGPYELLEKLGSGGNGQVWQAVGPNGEVAVKILTALKRPDAATRFRSEMQALNMLKGTKAALPLLDSGSDERGRPWYAMPVARPLSSLELNLDEALEALHGVAGALKTSHDLGISHRDIKPENLFAFDGGYVLGDFGLASFEGKEPLTAGGQKLGPLYYIAPEMLNSPESALGRPADVYSLGKVLWVMCTGQRYPYPGVHEPSFHGAAIASYVRDARAASLDELVRRMTVSDPSGRPAADVVVRELAAARRRLETQDLPDTEEILGRLRAAAASHLSLEQKLERQIELANKQCRPIAEAAAEAARLIQDKTGLTMQFWQVPNHWGVHTQVIGAPEVLKRFEVGHAFVGGGAVRKWRLGFGMKAELLSTEVLSVHVGFYLEGLIRGRPHGNSIAPVLWSNMEEAPNGGAQCAELISRQVSGLRSKLPAALEVFLRHVEDASR